MILVSICLNTMSRLFEHDLSNQENVVQDAKLIEDPLMEKQYTPSDSDSDDVLESENEDWNINSDFDDLSSKDEEDTLRIVRQDILVAKEAGFRVGYLGSLDGVFVVSLGCRISRLGINEDVMQAWGIKPREYIVLLIRYSSSYRSFGEIIQAGDRQRLAIQLHVGLCDSYKPGSQHVHKLYTDGLAHGDTVQGCLEGGDTGFHLRPIFVGDTLNGLLNDRFLAIVKSRWQFGFSWKGAELYIHHNQGKFLDGCTDLSEAYFEPDVYGDAGPAFLTFDHMDECNGDASQISYPLVAMQFTLRHFVYCTKFCLICHCRLEHGYESLKPFVCSNALCMYQYMSLGIGTSLEYEIRTEPYVVDLLISLTYTRAASKLLDDLPSSLRFMVPGEITNEQEMDYPRAIWQKAPMIIRFDGAHPFKAGDWLVLKEEVDDGYKAQFWHCRVRSQIVPGTLLLSRPVNTKFQPQQRDTKTPEQVSIEVQVIPYDRDFDELELDAKQSVLSSILDTVPSVDEMAAFLGVQSTNRELSAWKERISPAALGILRWIVASNRSYIKLDDSRNPEKKIPGMHDFIQFRLIQGAPDKEHEFATAVIEHGHRTSPTYPTIFAWHGSPLRNWHSILRQGLHFDYTSNGRSYGNGVYFSSSFSHSISYTSGSTLLWRNSKLNAQSVVSLNELVNDTKSFVHSRSCFVVDKLDWIQPRFLFVKPRIIGCLNGLDSSPRKSSAPTVFYEQDPTCLAEGPGNTQIKIPASAFGRRAWELGSGPGRPVINLSRKRKRDTSPSTIYGDTASIETDSEDLELLLSDDESEAQTNSTSTARDFVPGTLTEDELPLITPPTYATDSTTSYLRQQLQRVLEIQERKPLQTLGWYINPDLIGTVYQWIVELHSFDDNLPLSQDLKKVNMQSVVMEIRFLATYPQAPPFVRVIRPRILEFGAGGGGPVTTGGAFCPKLLSNFGWLDSMPMESVLEQVRKGVCSVIPRPVRVARASRQQDYSLQGAVDTYRTACREQGYFAHTELCLLAE